MIIDVIRAPVVLGILALCDSFCIASAVWQTTQHSLAPGPSNRSLATPAFLTVRKPPRIFRSGPDQDETIDENIKRVVTQRCGETVVVDSSSEKDGMCPDDCPYYVQDKTDDRHCSFRCVPADQCTKYNPKATVADSYKGTCRPPTANFCRDYDKSGKDRCAVCKRGFELDEHGQCHFGYYVWAVIYAVLVVGGVAIALLLAMLINMGCREKTNVGGLNDGLGFRTAQKLRQTGGGPGARREQWPLSTNLMTSLVAGPGMTLHFNFQMVIIVWAFAVATVWVLIAYVEDPVFDRLPDLLRLGTRRFGMPRENCIMVAWGYETQMRLMWVKIAFLVFVYVFSFALAIYHSVRQLRLFEQMDRDNSTMVDFAVLLSGLPPLSGSESPEKLIAQAVEEATDQEVIGVSVAWDFLKDEKEVMKAAKELVYDIDFGRLARAKTQEELAVRDVQLGGWQKTVFDLEKKYLTDSDEPAEEVPPEGEEDGEPQAGGSKAEKMKAFLDGLVTTEFAFVVFRTEARRNDALEKVNGSFDFRGCAVKMEATRAEPDTVQWENFGHSDTWSIVKRLALGCLFILLGLLVWTVVFYGPYTWSIFSFNYENGNEPGFVYGFAFSMVVVVGNAIMYEICARVSDMVGFHYRDNREACYMIMYTIACTFNILLDLVTTYFMIFEISKGLGFRTYHGEKLSDIDTFHEQFETYAMQRLLGENTFDYAFPSTMLIPFLIEPFVTIYLPLKVGVLIVRSHPELVGGAAEEYLAAIPMDMGRYADILLDVVLAVLVLYFPGGWTWQLYFALAGCHVLIYAFDHWKVLRNIPACTYASMDVDWWSQLMIAPCVGVIAACLVFKANCQGHGFCLEGSSLPFVCAVAFALHCVAHVLLLVYFVPTFSTVVVGADAETSTYGECASSTACNWFTANPVHCLRSEYTFEDTPACTYFMPGKEHCQQVNEKIGVFFSDSRVEMENYDDGHLIAQASQFLVGSASKLLTRGPSLRSPSETTPRDATNPK